MIFFFAVLVFMTGSFFVIGFLLSGPSHRGEVSDHFDGKKFLNPGNAKAKGLTDVFQWMMQRKQGPWTEKKEPAIGKKPEAMITEGMKITFVNHSTFLIQLDGVNILTDPVWSERVSPFQFAGPKRMKQPGIRFEDLPKIDYVLLSHNHYDHLDINTIKDIDKVHRPKMITPLGVKAFLDSQQLVSAVDLDWWQEIQLTASLSVQAVPAQHFSGRGVFDRDATLWCGYVIKNQRGNIYFAGDTGYNKFTFKEIGTRCAPVSVALIPIGAFQPTWFMSPIHCSPSEAVQIHFDVMASQSIATHFGTFPLADDGEDEPIQELQKAMNQTNLSPDKFLVLKEGEGRLFD